MITLDLLGDRQPLLRPGDDISGFGGISGIPHPDVVGDRTAASRTGSTTSRSAPRSPSTCCCATSCGRRSASTLQGVRDDPVRMRSLGYNVALHRTLAFALRRVRRRGRRHPLRLVERRTSTPRRSTWARRSTCCVIAVIGGLLPARGRLGRRALLRHHQQLLAATIGFIGATFPHADRGDLPRHRAGLARTAWSASGSARSRGVLSASRRDAPRIAAGRPAARRDIHAPERRRPPRGGNVRR